MTGHVYINGQIGNSYDDNGAVSQKGVELIDVVSQVSELGDVEAIHVHIDSNGGFVSVGNSIAEFLGSLKNCFTIAENNCASIATAIHLSVPLQNRMIQEGCNYLIHNPFLQSVTGDASQLQSLADSIKETESELIEMYAKATGVTKEAISGLMAIETSLTAEQCIKMKFASSITQKETARAVALIYTQKQNEMNKPLMSRMALAMAVLAGTAQAVVTTTREALAMTLVTDLGTLETPFSDLMVGDTATLNGAPATSGTYTLEDGTILEVVDGVIMTITPAEPMIEDSIKELNAKIEALTAQNLVLETEKTEANATALKVVEEMEALALVRSNHTPPQARAAFKPVVTPIVEKSIKEKAEARRAELSK
jgi:ATP-dependent protease ClpP protease subunit